MKKGDKITVIGAYGRVVRTLVQVDVDPRDRSIPCRLLPIPVLQADEGITWARGWDTKEARALQAAAALSS